MSKKADRDKVKSYDSLVDTINSMGYNVSSDIETFILDELKRLWTDLSDGGVIESIAIDSEEGLMVLRHSTAHVLAQAVQELFPQTRLGIGPPIKDGFYYDFDPERPFNPDNLTKLESAMKKIIKDGQRFKRRPISDSDALTELANEPYKCELVKLKSSDAAEGASV